MPENPLLTGDFTPQQLKVVETGITDVKVIASVSQTEGLEVEIVDLRPQRAEAPTRASSVADRHVIDVMSFLDELARRPLTECGTLWGCDRVGKVTAVYNDHPTSATEYGHADDEFVMQLTADDDWSRWHNLSGSWHSQQDFGDIIEDLLHTVVSPDQAELLEIIDSIRASTKGEFQSEIERSSGSQKATFNREVTATAGRTVQLEIPKTITLRLRPWEGHATFYEVQAWFRLRVNSGQLSLSIKLFPTRQIVRNAWAEVVTKIAETTGKPVLAL